MGVCVVKLGGSVFALPDVAATLEAWLQRQPKHHHVIVTGGGALADQVRQLDRQGGASAETAHWMAVRAMSVLAWALSQMNNRWSYLDDWFHLQRCLAARGQAQTIVFDPARFLREHEPMLAGVRLPIGWQVTSDSIAARVADLLAADELVLLKRQLPPADNLQHASRTGYVDAFFLQALHNRPTVRCVALPSQQEKVAGTLRVP
jgi:aspartokinase-like uncharacterized kinase